MQNDTNYIQLYKAMCFPSSIIRSVDWTGNRPLEGNDIAVGSYDKLDKMKIFISHSLQNYW